MRLRSTNIEKLDQRTYDVLILGGGINGAVAASALTTQGASVALIDRGDFAGFTSQSSSNLVWGGIKYLEGAEFGLVLKLCAARNHLIRTYPSSVKEVRFFAALEHGFRRSRFTIFAGALLYWAMGRFFTQPPRLLSAARMQAEEPRVDTDNCPGGLEYSDAYLVDNDARFVWNFVRAAMDHGGNVANYVEALGSDQQPDGLWVTRARDLLSGRDISIRSQVLINACGPYVDGQNLQSQTETEHHHVFSKGIHLIVPKITPTRHVITFFASDGRLFFVIPMGTQSCIGTTDTRVEELPARITQEDRLFVLDNVNKRLRLEQPLTTDDIIAERCGVRPLVLEPQGGSQDEGDWTSLSRKHVVEVDDQRRHISIFGGKLTDCLNVGEEITAEVAHLGVQLPHRGMRWYGEPPDEVRDEFFHQARLMDLDGMTAKESTEKLSTRLWRRYAATALSLLEEIRQDPSMAEVMIHGTEYIRCEIRHAARCEMVTRLEDFLRRRSKIALIASTAQIRQAPGLMEACHVLFGDEAQSRFDEYFAGAESATG